MTKQEIKKEIKELEASQEYGGWSSGTQRQIEALRRELNKPTEELRKHYDFYVDNCTKDEIPVSFEIWCSEYSGDLKKIMTKQTQCLYCENMTNEPHFVSSCCDRGMCDECYGTDVGTMEQIQVSYMDKEDYDTIKEEFKNAEYLCFECADIWQNKQTNTIKKRNNESDKFSDWTTAKLKKEYKVYHKMITEVCCYSSSDTMNFLGIKNELLSRGIKINTTPKFN